MGILKSGKKCYNIGSVLKSWKIYQNTAVLKYGFYTLQAGVTKKDGKNSESNPRKSTARFRTLRSVSEPWFWAQWTAVNIIFHQSPSPNSGEDFNLSHHVDALHNSTRAIRKFILTASQRGRNAESADSLTFNQRPVEFCGSFLEFWGLFHQVFHHIRI